MNRVVKIAIVFISFIFLTGFIPFVSLLGPSYTAIKSGSIYKASAQYFINKGIEVKTGKNSLALVKDEVRKQNNKRDFNQEFKKLVEKRIALTHKKLIKQNNQKKFNEGLKRLIEKRFAIVQKKLIVKKFSQ